MEFIKLMLTRSKWFYGVIILSGLVNGMLSISILFFINRFVSQNPLMGFFRGYDYAVYAGAIFLSWFLNYWVQVYLIKITNDIVLTFETNILEKLKSSNYESFEKLGSERVFTAINDTRTLARIPGMVMSLLNASVIVIGSFGYMTWVSGYATMLLLAPMILLLILYLVKNARIEKQLNILRDLQDAYYRYLNDFLLGFREIKSDPSRTQTIVSHYLIGNRLSSKDINVTTSVMYMNNELIGSYSWYAIIGVILFLLPRAFAVGMGDLSVFILSILFMMGSVSTLISVFPAFSNIKIAIQRLTNFNQMLEAKLRPEIVDEVSAVGSFDSLYVNGVTYQYEAGVARDPFCFGPVDFSIHHGEIVFIIGGNGSGKSTFVKLLVGLYTPHDGDIMVNSFVVREDNLKRQVAVVFSDPYLFTENYSSIDMNRQADRLGYLTKLMRLEKVISFQNGEARIDGDLSSGQRKRLALMNALLEDKPILVLDEWAAEQDPEFRNFFYFELLPLLRKEGKTIIAITHDDKYFSCADRIVKFEYGKVVDYAHETDIKI